MKEFESCEKCKYRRKSEYEYPCERCTHRCVVKEQYEPMTNADRIRDMDDEELAEFLCNVNQYSDMQVPSDKEINVMLDWLQSEVEEVNDPEPCETAQPSWKDQMLRKFIGRRQ